MHLNAGDELTIDATVTACTANISTKLEYGIYDQSVTDFTVQQAPRVGGGNVIGQGQVKFVAPSTGEWVLFATNSACDTMAYTFEASVVVFTGTHVPSGGATIAAAPQLPLGMNVAAGWERGHEPSGEYWRVYLNAGDELSRRDGQRMQQQ